MGKAAIQCADFIVNNRVGVGIGGTVIWAYGVNNTESAIRGLNRAWKQNFDWGDVTSQGHQWQESGMIGHGVGRIFIYSV